MTPVGEGEARYGTRFAPRDAKRLSAGQDKAS